MADSTFTNTALSAGTYAGAALNMSTSVTVTLADGLTMVITADKMVWSNGGELTYTVTITNNADQSYTGIVLSDTLDPTIVTLVADSVMDGSTELVLDTDYTYDTTTGALSITAGDLANAGATKVISFRVVEAA